MPVASVVGLLDEGGCEEVGLYLGSGVNSFPIEASLHFSTTTPDEPHLHKMLLQQSRCLLAFSGSSQQSFVA